MTYAFGVSLHHSDGAKEHHLNLIVTGTYGAIGADCHTSRVRGRDFSRDFLASDNVAVAGEAVVGRMDERQDHEREFRHHLQEG